MINPFSHINNIHWHTQTVLPAVFDDELSYYEVLSKFGNKLNEVIDIVNSQGEGIYTYIENLFDEYKTTWNQEVTAQIQGVQDSFNNAMSQWQGQLDSVTNQVNSLQSSFDLKYVQLETEFDAKLNQLNDSLQANLATFENNVNKQLQNYQLQVSQQQAEIYSTITSTNQATRTWMTTQLEDFKHSLPKDYPPIICPVDGKLEDIQSVVNHMWNYLNSNALTADEYDALDLTATEYDDKGLTANQYDQMGKLLLSTSTTSTSKDTSTES